MLFNIKGALAKSVLEMKFGIYWSESNS